MQFIKEANNEVKKEAKTEKSVISRKAPEGGNQFLLRNMTGIPTELKRRSEEKSGVSLDDVRVHYNSEKPAALHALAYTQGSQVYLGPGQEQHLAHELGHVVQQKEGRVKATGMVAGQPVNDDPDLEREADQM